MRRLFSLIAILTLCAGLAACGGALFGGGGRQAALPDALERGDYRLGAGDEMRIVVFGQDQLSGEFVVDGSGAVSLPLVGEIPASGQTLREFERTVEDRLRGDYLVDPRVSVQVITFRPYYILGEVNRPGQYPFADALTVLNAIATAGGFTYRADTGRVMIKRAGEDVEHAVRLTPGTRVYPGDTVRIPERFF